MCLSGTKVPLFSRVVALANLPSIFGDGFAAKEHALAFRYSKVSRHYGLPTHKPSFWVNVPALALRVWDCILNTRSHV